MRIGRRRALALLAGALVACRLQGRTVVDVTSAVVRLGNPAHDFNGAWTYAKNVWDMQRFPLTGSGQKLYIADGNQAHTGADNDSWPVSILVYDPSTNSFSNQGVTNSNVAASSIQQQQLDRFRVLDFGSGDQLCILGSDPDSNGTEWYRLESGTWVYRRASSPASVHGFDILLFGGDLFAATVGAVGSVSRSTDGGSTWTEHTGMIGNGNHLFSFGSKLYLVTTFPSSVFTSAGLWEWQGGTTWTGVSGSSFRYDDMFPGHSRSGQPNAKIIRSAVLGSAWVYIGTAIDNTYHDNPFGLYSLTGISTSGVTGVTARTLPGSPTPTPYDLMVIGSTLYVLGNHTSGSDTVVGVYSTTDLSTWTTECTFKPDQVGSGSQGQAFARSFELLGTTWYFGLGSLTSPIPSNTGDVLAYTPASSVTTGRRFVGASRRHRSAA